MSLPRRLREHSAEALYPVFVLRRVVGVGQQTDPLLQGASDGV
jgi:hypothetical protein